jgi:hypothetical protein
LTPASERVAGRPALDELAEGAYDRGDHLRLRGRITANANIDRGLSRTAT